MKFLKSLTMKQWLIIGIVILFIIILIVWLNNRNSKPTVTTNVVGGGNSSTSTTTSTSKFPLTYGSTGNEVMTLQSKINSTEYLPKLVVDGIWGTKTQAGVLSVFKISSISQEFYNSNIK